MSAYYELNGKKKTIDYNNKTEVYETSDAETTGYKDLRGRKYVPKPPVEEDGGGSGANEDFVKLIDKSIEVANIPEGVTSIGNQVFFDCSNLTSVTIPSSVTSIGDRAFSKCSKLTGIVIPDSVTSVGTMLCNECSSLTNATISNNITEIPTSMFEGCSKLTSIVIPSGVTRIGLRAFMNCSSLTSIIIPSAVTNIGEQAFSGCTSLNEIIVEATTPPMISSATFASVPSTAKIYVPSEAVSAYRAATNWKKRASYIRAIPE